MSRLIASDLHLPLLPIVTLCMLGLTSCATTPFTEGHPNQEALKGKPKDQIISCAGPPFQEGVEGTITYLRYYREAPILEESSVASKGSLSGVHHGCWATVVFDHDHVDDVLYRFVPESFDASNDCEEIFLNCVP